MTETYVTNADFARRLRNRPAGYSDEIAKITTRRDAGGFWIDVASPVYRELVEKYRNMMTPKPPNIINPSFRCGSCGDNGIEGLE